MAGDSVDQEDTLRISLRRHGGNTSGERKVRLPSEASRGFDTDAHKAHVSSVRSPLAARRDSAIGEA
jgi:hypothetical protein